MSEKQQYCSRLSLYYIISTIFFSLLLVGAEITVNLSPVSNEDLLKTRRHSIVSSHLKLTMVSTSFTHYNLFLMSSAPSIPYSNNKRERLIHSSFRLKGDILKSLELVARKKGISLSTLVNQTLENYVTSEMYFEELGFLLMPKDFLSKVINGLTESQAQDLGRTLGSNIAKEYISFFFPIVDKTNLAKFLDLWFKRFQSYQHKVENARHYFVVNHEISMNFSIVLKSMLQSLVEHTSKNGIQIDITPRVVVFSFDET